MIVNITDSLHSLTRLTHHLLRLREELDRRSRATVNLRDFAERLNASELDETYTTILRHSTELLGAERGSLLLFDEGTRELEVKAVVGPHAEDARASRIPLGEGVSGSVLNDGRALVVKDVRATGWNTARTGRSYKTDSFISFPIIIGGRKVGVLNVTDKVDGSVYDEFDLDLLEMIAPQIALALERTRWHLKATRFQLLSITDPLTGLHNRRYLEERITEEIERSKRHHFPVCFMMIDIDDFKQYNDRNGHQAGDLALEMTAQSIKSALRTEDVASRYGGEEFSVLLPQTNLSKALIIAERIRRRVERARLPNRNLQLLNSVHVSIGVAEFGPHVDTPISLISAADQSLYIAKRRGKNCIDSYTPSTPSKI